MTAKISGKDEFFMSQLATVKKRYTGIYRDPEECSSGCKETVFELYYEQYLLKINYMTFRIAVSKKQSDGILTDYMQQ